jgi:hypothetical protein
MTLKKYNDSSDLVILAEYKDPLDNEYFFLLDESLNQISFATKSVGAAKGFKDFLMKHPYMTGMAVAVGMNALDTYKSNKRLTTRFFATTQIEREMYKNMSEELAKGGNYTILKRGKRVKGGWLWELKKKG